MKKNFKKIIILSMALVSLIGFSTNAKASQTKFTKDVNFSSIRFRGTGSNYDPYDGRLIVSGMTDGENQFKIYTYDMKASDGNTFISYCMDPHKGANTNTNAYHISRVLGDGEVLFVRAFDAGILEIIKEGYNQYNDSYNLQTTTPEGSINTVVSGKDLYVATSIAVRAYALGLFSFGGDVTLASGQKLASAHITTGLRWSSYRAEKINEIVQYYLKDVCKSSSDWVSCYRNNYIVKYAAAGGWYEDNYDLTTSNQSAINIIYAAQSLFFAGVDKAYEITTGTSKTPVLSLETDTSTENISKDDTQTQEYIYQKFTVSDFSEKDGKLTNVTYSCPNCSANGVTINAFEVYNSKTKEFVNVSANTNLLDYLEAKDGYISGEIKTRLKVTKSIKEDCNNTKYTINYEYNDSTLEYSGALLATNDSKKQKFFIIQKNEENIKSDARGTIKCSGLTCETEMGLPVCSTDEDDSVATITGPTKIKSCVIDNNDDADNSYQFTSNAGGVDNKYCKVYCKEDYSEIRLNPVVQNVKCGGYFKLKSYIKGTKTCYTGGNTDENATNGAKSIDKEQYLIDIKDVQEKLVDAMNRYYEYKAKSEHSYDSSSTTKTCGGSSCGSKETITIKWDSYDKVTFTWNANTESGSYNYGTANGGSSSWSDQCSCNTCGTPKSEGGSGTYSCCGGCDNNASSSYSSWKSNVNTQLAKAKSDLTTYMAKYKEYIQSFNACTTAWTNEFAFEQKVKYYYDENRGTTGVNFTPYYELLDQNEDLKYLEKDGEEKVEYSIKVNKGKTDEKYESGTWITVSNENNKADNSSKDEYNYNSAYGSSVFDTRNYVICSVAKGCVSDTRQISQAAFIKKEVTKEQNYITPTAFYQIAANGKVVMYDSSYAFERVQLEELTNKLPISTSSVGGGIFKLMIEGLGEFYSEKNEYGRLIDFEQSNEKKSVVYVQGLTYKLAQYSCYYENDCRPKDCPNCEFICEGDGCEWKECPSCNISCVNCIFNLDNLNIIAKTITTTDVKAANRTYGYNWITTSSMQALNLLNKKASVTIEEIEEINEMVYNDKTTDGSTLGFSIKLTPEIISKIKEYNKKNEENGGYINNSLTCYDASIGGETYKNIYCYSELIDELLEENDTNVTVLPSRVNNEGQRSSSTQNSGYWTLWSSFSVDKTSESVIGGPSWK